MLLKSSIFLILLLTILTSNIYILITVAGLMILSNLLFNKTLKSSIKKMKYVFLLYFTTVLFQLFMIQEGEVIFKIYNYYITWDGLIQVGINFLRIFDILLISWLINAQNIFTGRFKRYNELIDIIIELVPEVFVLFRKKMRFKLFFRHILKQIEGKI
ncbi:MAG: hypothetical protein DSY38_04160 [Fusobacteria bacterium]|nr:MAG: hypothetical protein DSY38_04160 [Fusobacteriota bacterium]